MNRVQIVALLKASHFWPTVLVVSVTFALSLTLFSIYEALFIALAIFLGQLVIGWTNDLIDFPRDKAAMRYEKPLVAGTIDKATLKVWIFIAICGAVIVSLLSPLGVMGSTIHFLGLLSAFAYNVKLKATLFSVVPYIFSFGALPMAIYISAGSAPMLWVVLSFIFFASAFHFLNVLKDLEVDMSQDVMGLPQVLGRKKSIAAAQFLIGLGIVNIFIALRR